MQKRSAPDSGFLTFRSLVALLLFTAACLIATGTLLAFFRSEAPAYVSHPAAVGLTFAERVAYQRAIEDVYWRHRIWPEQQPNAKPSLDAAMPQAEIQKKVTEYLRKSQALEDYWQRPITAEQLQAEMDRMARQTKHPDVLRELFEALGNDPFVIAECLARPALADRLLTNLYACDQTFHNVLKRRAESELGAVSNFQHMKQLSGTYREIEFVKTDSLHRRTEYAAGESVKLNSQQWDQTTQKLAARFNQAPRMPPALGCSAITPGSNALTCQPHQERTTWQEFDTIAVGKLSPLQEDETRFFATAVIEKNSDRFKLATVSWQKEPMETWLAKAEKQVPAEMTVPQASYNLPKISVLGTCNENTWTATAAPPEARDSHTAVWTGSEMIIWGGEANNSIVNSGGRYDPATDTWASINTSGAPTARARHTAVWTGIEMIVWGGWDENFSVVNTGGKYNPGTNSWTPTSTTNAPTGRERHTAVWTGSQMIVWGGL